MAEYQALWDRARDDPEGFWAEMAQVLTWDQPWDKVLDWTPPHAKWFVGGKLNAAYNCVDRHCEGPQQEQGRPDLRRRAGRPPGPPLSGPPARGRHVRQRAEEARGQARRRRRHLHADDPRGGHRDARLRPDRRASHGRLRRVQRRGAGRVGSRTARPRCSSPPTAASAEARSSRSRRTPTAPWRTARPSRSVVVYKRTGQEVAMT